VLQNREGSKVAVSVNDMGEVNVVAELVAQTGSLNHVDEKLVEMTNGCICCTLREDLLIEVGRLARDGRFDYLLIESTGVSEPIPVAETFTFADGQGRSLADVARLDILVTVVDAVNFPHLLTEAASLSRSISNRLPRRRAGWPSCAASTSRKPTSTALAASCVGPGGQGLDESRARAALDACLLNDAELERGPNEWKRFADPFPQCLQMVEEDDEVAP